MRLCLEFDFDPGEIYRVELCETRESVNSECHFLFFDISDNVNLHKKNNKFE